MSMFVVKGAKLSRLLGSSASYLVDEARGLPSEVYHGVVFFVTPLDEHEQTILNELVETQAGYRTYIINKETL